MVHRFLAATTLAWAALSAWAPLSAQMNMPGMKMPMPKKSAAKKAQPKTHAVGHRHARASPRNMPVSKPADHSQGSAGMPAMTMPMMPGEVSPNGGSSMPMGQMPMPMPEEPGANPQPMRGMDHQQMGQMAGMQPGQTPHRMNMKAALGPYLEQRESSGTAWQPDASSPMGGPMIMSGDWMLMAHGTVNLVADHQSGPRGDDKAFVSGMLMGMAQRPFGNGTLQFRAMLSPDPLMGPSGYPLLLASGETANGRDRLIDRQHPHDFFMELSASASQNVGSKSSIFVYAGLPGEPAFGPPTFMHRESVMDFPEAPITHHWLDSTHITFGVLTAGLVLDRLKVEASRFNGREPDQHRWNIETGPLDSSSVRVSWNPTRTLALQGSWAHLVDPEQLEPGVDQKRWSASALWANDLAAGWHAAATLAWGRKVVHGHKDDGIAAEASLKHAEWTLFGRGEMVRNRELLDIENGPAFRVGKVSVGAIRDVRIADHLSLGAGGLFSVNFVPTALAPLYGSRNPVGTMAFMRLKLD